jgi:AcrR family transcriptional regulator
MDEKREERLQSMLNMIVEELTDLRANKLIFDGFMEIVESNPDLPSNNLFIVWAWKNYLFTAAMGVRRQLSRRYDDVSLANLLEYIKREPEYLSRERYASLFSGTGFEKDSDYINGCYDSIAGEGKGFMDSEDIERDIACLDATAECLKDYATKVIAHAGRDVASIRTLPTIHDLEASLDLFEKVLNRYFSLINAGAIELPKVAQVPWVEIFLIPWKVNKKRTC